MSEERTMDTAVVSVKHAAPMPHCWQCDRSTTKKVHSFYLDCYKTYIFGDIVAVGQEKRRMFIEGSVYVLPK